MLIYCADYRCSHYIAISGDRWPDDVCLSDLEPRFSDKRGADVRPDFNWDKPGSLSRGYERFLIFGCAKQAYENILAGIFARTALRLMYDRPRG